MSVHEAHIDLWLFAREEAVVPKHVLNNDKLSTVAAVNESQNSEIEMVTWQVRLTDQVRYHQHSSSVFVGARLDGLLAPPALKLKNWAIRKSLGNRGWPPPTHTPTHTHTHIHTYTQTQTQTQTQRQRQRQPASQPGRQTHTHRWRDCARWNVYLFFWLTIPTLAAPNIAKVWYMRPHAQTPTVTP